MKRLTQLFLAIILFVASPIVGHAAVSYDAQSSSAVSGADTLSFNHTNAGDLLVCGVSYYTGGGGTLSTATYNSVAMTQVHEETKNGGNNVFRVYRLIAPAAGTNSVSFTFAATTNPSAGCLSFGGAHQTVPIGTAVADTDGAPMSMSITVAANGMGAAFAFDNPNNDCPTYTSDQTIRFTVCLNDNSVIGSTTASTGSVAMTFGNLTDQYAIVVGIAVPIEPAAAAATRIQRRVIVIP